METKITGNGRDGILVFKDKDTDDSSIFHSWYLQPQVKKTYFGNPESGCGMFMPKRWLSLRKMVQYTKYVADVDLTMFFVGDAGGRMMGHATSRTKDFADTDRLSLTLSKLICLGSLP